MKEWEIKIKDLIHLALLFRLSDSIACILNLGDILLLIQSELGNFTLFLYNYVPRSLVLYISMK